MPQILAILAMTSVAGAVSALHEVKWRTSSGAFLDAKEHPEEVARKLSTILDGWKSKVDTALEGGYLGRKKESAFHKSCSTVATAIVEGSTGNRDDAKEYVTDICKQPAVILSSWRESSCLLFKTSIESAMGEASYENRENLDVAKVCSGVWDKLLETEGARQKKEAAEHAEAERKAAEQKAERDKRVAQMRAERQKRAAEEAKKNEEARKRKAAEEAEQKKEAESKRQAAELAAKKAEAEKAKAEAEEMAMAAKARYEEAEAAEREHHRLLAKANATAKELLEKTVDKKSNVTQSEVVAPNATKAEATQKSTTL